VTVRYADSLVLGDLAARIRGAVRRAAEGVGARPGRIDVGIDDVRVG
jgi:hypothetical protein